VSFSSGSLTKLMLLRVGSCFRRRRPATGCASLHRRDHRVAPCHPFGRCFGRWGRQTVRAVALAGRVQRSRVRFGVSGSAHGATHRRPSPGS
jgi:hypothetical protein